MPYPKMTGLAGLQNVSLWPFSTHATMYADVGFWATAEVVVTRLTSEGR